MKNKEQSNWKKAMHIGFYVYIFVLAFNYFNYLLTNNELLSPTILFFSGLLAAFFSEIVFTLKDKFQVNGGKPSE